MQAEPSTLDTTQAALVSVQGTRGFWQRQGFSPAAAQPPALASYGADALYMTRTLDG